MKERPPDAHGLPSGGWVLVRDFDAKPATQGEREDVSLVLYAARPEVRQLVQRKAPDDAAERAAYDAEVEAACTPDDLRALFEMNRLLAAMAVADWSFDAPISAASVRDLPADDYDELMAVGAKVANSVLAGVDFDPTPEPDSPTGPGSASSGH